MLDSEQVDLIAKAMPSIEDAETRAKVFEWCSDVACSAALVQNLYLGHMEVVGFDDADGPLFSLTDVGRRYVEVELIGDKR